MGDQFTEEEEEPAKADDQISLPENEPAKADDQLPLPEDEPTKVEDQNVKKDNEAGTETEDETGGFDHMSRKMMCPNCRKMIDTQSPKKPILSSGSFASALAALVSVSAAGSLSAW